MENQHHLFVIPTSSQAESVFLFLQILEPCFLTLRPRTAQASHAAHFHSPGPLHSIPPPRAPGAYLPKEEDMFGYTNR